MQGMAGNLNLQRSGLNNFEWRAQESGHTHTHALELSFNRRSGTKADLNRRFVIKKIVACRPIAQCKPIQTQFVVTQSL
jgi:hypothetical protein